MRRSGWIAMDYCHWACPSPLPSLCTRNSTRGAQPQKMRTMFVVCGLFYLSSLSVSVRSIAQLTSMDKRTGQDRKRRNTRFNFEASGCSLWTQRPLRTATRKGAKFSWRINLRTWIAQYAPIYIAKYVRFTIKKSNGARMRLRMCRKTATETNTQQIRCSCIFPD